MKVIFNIVKDENGNVIGFMLLAGTDCSSFERAVINNLPRNFVKNETRIIISGDTMTIQTDGMEKNTRIPKCLEVKADDKELAVLEEIFHDDWEKLNVITCKEEFSHCDATSKYRGGIIIIKQSPC